MPTTPRKARLLLKNGRAKIVRREPFTIQLLYGSSGYVQPVTLGIDAGYETVGFSAVNEKEELLGGELKLLEGMSKRLGERAMYRRQRRSRQRHRQPRFDNRRKPKGWLAPSIGHKLDSHLRLIEIVKAILPVAKVVIEVANFDIQKIKKPDISGKQYQQGEQAAFWNIREYILHRDGHECQNPDCKNKAKNPVLEVHHLGYWKADRSDRPGNLITLCVRCHRAENHKQGGFLHGWQPRVKSFKPETFMSTVRWRMVNAAQAEHTYGYRTKQKRIALGLPKAHYHDAFVIAGGTTQIRAELLLMEQIRRNNRSLQKFYDAKYIDTQIQAKRVELQQVNYAP
jgi:5-methylcytosine-specific restriction endonuclease McrA